MMDTTGDCFLFFFFFFVVGLIIHKAVFWGNPCSSCFYEPALKFAVPIVLCSFARLTTCR